MSIGFVQTSSDASLCVPKEVVGWRAVCDWSAGQDENVERLNELRRRYVRGGSSLNLPNHDG